MYIFAVYINDFFYKHRDNMLSKNVIKLVHSLAMKKNRQREGLFVAEGRKTVEDLMRKIRPELIVATDGWVPPAGFDGRMIRATEEELHKVSFLKTPQQVLALFPTGGNASSPVAADFSRRLCLALDGVQDPGNLGTIIRIADWFGIETILCSPDTADVYNPKVVQATMGSLAHVDVVYTDLPALLDTRPAGTPVYGTLLDGESIYARQLSGHGIIVMGNEGNGISPAVRSRITDRLLIPSFARGDRAESLNVAVATAVVCSEFRRK